MGADWLNTLEDVGGRLVPAARDFVDSQRPPLPGTGARGIRWLAAQLEDFVDRDTDGSDDDRFVEGAGALLGLLLIDHLGGRTRERDGCHRVQLGRFGWFDPFGTIQEALDAEDPRGCLSEYLSVAEREAADDGPVSRVVRVFANTLGRERPDLDIESQFELTLDLNNGASVDLARLERVARDQDDDAATEAARRIISMLPGANTQAETPWNEAAPRLVPRLVSEQFLASLPNEQTLYADALGNDVHFALQLRYGTRARYVRCAEVDSWALERAAARQQAIENLSAKSRSLRLERVTEEILRVRQGDGLDGARLMLPDLAARLTKLQPGTWIAAAPHRDVLLLARGEAIRELSRRAEDAVRRAPHPISAAIFAITPQGPRPLRR
ncbi:MAG: DUF1444 family protein [Deltaproteobacteria bacterium]|nr:DUF1444 family protein [Deltaproteobacteria bacterium]MBW2211356.1 DUF1444 family protein [Deltaproteobacteria bacterium]MBW2215125.1 DUF1444 family protein [Deltaproteobacteria bacterium]MBW2550823.1 DUF1444 family protein [Deltaproteobacteria bacterium]MBW2626843.1 DUF1444 family protein [Deltaproteobacteria bacterium]